VKVDLCQPTKAAGEAAFVVLERAVADLKAGKIDVLVTAPINKSTIQSEEFNFPGHTEYLEASMGDGNKSLMILYNERVKVALVTTHLPISQVSAAITKEAVLEKLELFNNALKQDFAIEYPRIAVLGLNPHSGDNGLIGKEEKEVIIPALEEAADRKISCFGPYSADGFFGLGNYAKFDAVLAMYHDQGLTPFKALAFEDGVNYTAGLPVVRTSPDHGTAYEMAGRDMADPRSMKAAIYAAIDIFNKRADFDELVAGRMTIKMPDTEIKPKGGRIIE
jgi:4-hydroxythreonine-4-phosphate dehydrogenase